MKIAEMMEPGSYAGMAKVSKINKNVRGGGDAASELCTLSSIRSNIIFCGSTIVPSA